MSDVEALMWALDADPVLSSTFANITFLDRAPDRDRLRRRLWRATRVVPRLRRRAVEGVGPVTPRWEEDPDFDLDRHLRWIHLDGATDEEVRQLAVDAAATPFDRSRPSGSSR
ncbi:MAG: wax ester/triacylglycerol synthase family O-acyltransferase [Acidimicrobiales bacterium]